MAGGNRHTHTHTHTHNHTHTHTHTERERERERRVAHRTRTAQETQRSDGVPYPRLHSLHVPVSVHTWQLPCVATLTLQHAALQSPDLHC